MKLLLTMLFTIFPLIAVAAWPMFAVPSVVELQNALIFDTADCESGFGKVHQGAYLALNKFTNNFCPSSWQWHIANDTQCINLKTLTYLNYAIEHVVINSVTEKSIVTAYYGVTGVPLFSLRFSTPNEHWYCCELNQNPARVSCANDM